MRRFEHRLESEPSPRRSSGFPPYRILSYPILLHMAKSLLLSNRPRIRSSLPTAESPSVWASKSLKAAAAAAAGGRLSGGRGKTYCKYYMHTHIHIVKIEKERSVTAFARRPSLPLLAAAPFFSRFPLLTYFFLLFTHFSPLQSSVGEPQPSR